MLCFFTETKLRIVNCKNFTNCCLLSNTCLEDENTITSDLWIQYYKNRPNNYNRIIYCFIILSCLLKLLYNIFCACRLLIQPVKSSEPKWYVSPVLILGRPNRWPTNPSVFFHCYDLSSESLYYLLLAASCLIKRKQESKKLWC